MPQSPQPQSKFDANIVPILHPNGSVHSVAIPPDLDFGDFHKALLDSEYGHQIFTQPQPQPRREDALEFSPQFRDAAAKAIMASHNFTGQEAGFAIRADGTPARNTKNEPVIQSSKEFGTGHNLKVITQASDMGIYHTHPHNPRPSPADIEDAKKNRMTIYAASPEGLWQVSASGEVQQVFQSRTWYSDKNPK
ncbi:MAG TPA: hypothetical protein VGR55_00465 [Candidatus Acidoferrum sp.]|nr:hypothetical protein [Candidatus Acidoferrum sp.]